MNRFVWTYGIVVFEMIFTKFTRLKTLKAYQFKPINILSPTEKIFDEIAVNYQIIFHIESNYFLAKHQSFERYHSTNMWNLCYAHVENGTWQQQICSCYLGWPKTWVWDHCWLNWDWQQKTENKTGCYNFLWCLILLVCHKAVC